MAASSMVVKNASKCAQRTEDDQSANSLKKRQLLDFLGERSNPPNLL